MSATPRVAVIIPARLASTRLPRKVLLNRTGKYLIQHVWERLAPLAGEVAAVIIAADSPEVAAAARSFGAETRLTRADHPSGTDRVAEAARDLAVDVVVNVQGDEPSIDPEDVRALAAPFAAEPDLCMATLARRRSDPEGRANPTLVKIVTDCRGCALYFSRAPVPYPREGSCEWLHHAGIYAYRKDFLLRLGELAPTPLERRERLEQLRVLEHGYKIKVVLTERSYEGIDTPEQYEEFVRKAARGDRL